MGVGVVAAYESAHHAQNRTYPTLRHTYPMLCDTYPKLCHKCSILLHMYPML